MDDVDVVTRRPTDRRGGNGYGGGGGDFTGEFGRAGCFMQSNLGQTFPPVIPSQVPVPVSVLDNVLHRLKPSNGAA